MPYGLLSDYLKLPIFLMVAARLAGMLLFQPILASRNVPVGVRLALVLGLSALVTPLVRWTPTLPDTALGLALALAGELLIGGLIGLVVAVAFVGVQMGAELVAQESGLAFGQIVDPTSGQSLSVLSVFYSQFVAVVYLIVGGHRAVLTACLDTFQTIPPLGDGGAAQVGVDLLVRSLALGGSVAVRVAAPAMVTMFLVTLTLGLISRTVPQLNVATVGFMLKTLIGFLIMAAALPATLAAFTDGLEAGLTWLHEFVHG